MSDKFDLVIGQDECDSVNLFLEQRQDKLYVGKKGLTIKGIDSTKFMFPESMNCEHIARVLAKEEPSDLKYTLQCLKEELAKQKIAFTFKID